MESHHKVFDKLRFGQTRCIIRLFISHIHAELNDFMPDLAFLLGMGLYWKSVGVLHAKNL